MKYDNFKLPGVRSNSEAQDQYHLLYTEGGSYKQKSFPTEAEAHKYMALELLPKAVDKDIRIDYMLKGEILLKA